MRQLLINKDDRTFLGGYDPSTRWHKIKNMPKDALASKAANGNANENDAGEEAVDEQNGAGPVNEDAAKDKEDAESANDADDGSKNDKEGIEFEPKIYRPSKALLKMLVDEKKHIRFQDESDWRQKDMTAAMCVFFDPLCHVFDMVIKKGGHKLHTDHDANFNMNQIKVHHLENRMMHDRLPNG